jgi:hypothetical protein
MKELIVSNKNLFRIPTTASSRLFLAKCGEGAETTIVGDTAVLEKQYHRYWFTIFD